MSLVALDGDVAPFSVEVRVIPMIEPADDQPIGGRFIGAVCNWPM
ncbi:hypothetical protein [Sulfitobacter sp. S223]|nr:hypothetical protein [Sulfitobacter sp. S223]